MKVVFATDIHESYRNLEKLFRMVEADLYIIAGDLLYLPFRSLQLASCFTELQQLIYVQGLQHKLDGTREHMARGLLDTVSASAELQERAREYLDMVARAQRTMLKKYERLARIFSGAAKPVITIPGNYDMDLSRTALSRWNLHKKTKSVHGITIAGYGGAPVFTPGVPESLRVAFREHFDAQRKLHSEPYGFFEKTEPDLILVHQPPYGYLDRIAAYGCIGSVGIRDFVDRSNVRMILSGHTHEDWGVIFKGGKAFINPSNFGRFVEVNRVKKGGYFAELYLDGKEFCGGMLRQIEGNSIYDIEQCMVRRGKFRLSVLDLKRYRYLSRIKKRQKHIKAIRLFNRIKGFFQKHETVATRRRILQLEAVLHEPEAEKLDLAVHLLGSLNFGMAEDVSDVDVVLYFRDPGLQAPDDEKHPEPGVIGTRLEQLKASGLELSICDCLNLAQIEAAIAREDTESIVLQRFIFYSSTCRCVNPRPIKEIEKMLLGKEDFRYTVEHELEEAFRMIISSFRHAFSFRKYQERLKGKGMNVPPYIEELIWEYLEQKSRSA